MNKWQDILQDFLVESRIRGQQGVQILKQQSSPGQSRSFKFHFCLVSSQNIFPNVLGIRRMGFAKCEMGLLCSFWSALVVASKLPYRCHFCQVSLLLNHEPCLFPVESEAYSASDVLGSDLMCGFYRLCSNHHLCVVLKILT
ncbi:hypothetical protein GOODEAATRI_020921 [Goodea atripinnis]|uniref:Uncharacterized protein n=1 Tax=Goodea atripinnis TaxID=208336 RepID=A0ABV0NLZ7_9TELE